ncbi:MAG: TrmH family RNA methyltransferase [Oscillospiraceae bacterium]
MGTISTNSEISSRKNKNVVLMRALLRERSERRKNRLFAAEGDHLCGEIASIAEDGDVALFLYTEKASEKYPSTVERLCGRCRESFCITEDLAEYISDTKSSQGLFAACAVRARAIPESAEKVVILDGVQDPGNVGTIIRTAEALGFGGVIFTGACADVYSPKVLRASMGSVLRLPFEEQSAASLGGRLEGFSLYAAMLDENAARLGAEKFPKRTAVVIGSEGGGVSPEIAAICGKKLYIPISGAESLNAAIAAAIIMWEISNS